MGDMLGRLGRDMRDYVGMILCCLSSARALCENPCKSQSARAEERLLSERQSSVLDQLCIEEEDSQSVQLLEQSADLERLIEQSARFLISEKNEKNEEEFEEKKRLSRQCLVRFYVDVILGMFMVDDLRIGSEAREQSDRCLKDDNDNDEDRVRKQSDQAVKDDDDEEDEISLESDTNIFNDSHD